MRHPRQALTDFLDGTEPVLGWEFLSKSPVPCYRLCSQNWQGNPWHHDVWWNGGEGDTAIINITGDRVDAADLPVHNALIRHSQMPVATLFDVPNQPLWDRREDDLIALSFEEYLVSGDPSWPLLFPMVQSVRALMEALFEHTSGKISKFVLTGGSKRGWTTYLAAGTIPRRVVGAAPMVFDNLNFPAQMALQKARWGDYSEKLVDYSSREMMQLLEQPRGLELAALVDPIHFLDQTQAPLLIITGTNDPFWMVDAAQVYLGDLPESARFLCLPNTGHDLQGAISPYPTVGEFARRCRDGRLLPELESVPRDQIQHWTAYGPNWQFADAIWQQAPEKRRPRAEVRLAQFKGDLGQYWLSSPVSTA